MENMDMEMSDSFILRLSEISRIQYILSSLKAVLCFSVLRFRRIFTIVAFYEEKIGRQRFMTAIENAKD